MKHQMNEEWASFWYQSLAANQVYWEFCRAWQSGNVKRVWELESEIKGITSIFLDFGELNLLMKPYDQSSEWSEWFEPRRHLFVVEPKVVTSIEKYRSDESELLLAVPLLETAKDTKKAFELFIDAYFARSKNIKPKRSKYQLYEQDGKLNAGYQRVRQACLCSYGSYAIDKDGDYRIIEDALQDFVRNNIEALGWHPERVRFWNRIREGGDFTPDEWKSLRGRVFDLRSDFRALSHGALRGRFPDVSTEGDEVHDEFWG